MPIVELVNHVEQVQQKFLHQVSGKRLTEKEFWHSPSEVDMFATMPSKEPPNDAGKKIQIGFRLDEETSAALEAFRSTQTAPPSVSVVVRMALREFLVKHGNLKDDTPAEK